MRRTATLYKNDIGARIVLRVKQKNGEPYDAISTALVKQIKVTTPSGTQKVFTATFGTAPFGDGTGEDGVVEYVTTAASDLPEAGVHKVQGYFEFTASDKRHTQPVTMYVGDIPD